MSVRLLHDVEVDNVTRWIRFRLFPRFGTSKITFLKLISIHAFCPKDRTLDPGRRDIMIGVHYLLNNFRMLYFLSTKSTR